MGVGLGSQQSPPVQDTPSVKGHLVSQIQATAHPVQEIWGTLFQLFFRLVWNLYGCFIAQLLTVKEG